MAEQILSAHPDNINSLAAIKKPAIKQAFRFI